MTPATHSMRVSIIIPTLNEAANIAAAIDRAWQTKPHEVIVADGGSQDETVILAEQQATTVVVGPAGRGPQLNQGANAATGDILLFLHADNWLATSGVQQIVAQFENDPHKHIEAFKQRINADGLAYRLLERGNAARVRHLGVAYGDQGIFCRRSLFDELGGFPKEPLMEDLLLMKRLPLYAWPVLLPGPLHVSPRRWKQHGIIRQTLRNWQLVASLHLGVSPDRLARRYTPHKT